MPSTISLLSVTKKEKQLLLSFSLTSMMVNGHECVERVFFTGDGTTCMLIKTSAILNIDQSIKIDP